jgi:SNF2 family DNA or RNA helicase
MPLAEKGGVKGRGGHPPDSAKIRVLLELLHKIRERGEEKTIIFSQFTSMLDLIQPFLKQDRIEYVRCKCLVTTL